MAFRTRGGPGAGPGAGPPPSLKRPTAIPRAFRYFRSARRWVFAAVIGLAGVSAATLASPQLIRVAVDRGIGLADPTIIAWAALGLVGIAALRGLFTFLQGYGMERASQGLAFELRDRLFAHTQELSFSYYDKVEAGQLLTRVTSDVEQVRQFVGAQFVQFAGGMLLLAGSIVILVATNWKLALLALLPIPLVLLLFFRFLRTGAPVFGRLQAKVGRLNGILGENMAGIRVVRAFAQEDGELARFSRTNESLFDDGLETARMIASNFPTVFVLGNLSAVLVVWVGGFDVIGGTLSIGELIAFTNYLGFLLFPILSLGFLAFGLARAEASAVRIFEVLDAPIDVADRPDAVELPGLAGRVEFDQVSFRYPGDARPALAGVSFVAEPGQTVAILGATGSGKSTIVNLIPRFYDVDSGVVRVDGHDVRGITLTSLRRQIGIVLQDSQLVRGTIRDNIAFGAPEASDADIARAAEAAQAAEFIDRLPDRYQTLVGDRGVGLSGGQRQRIAIARALLVRPKILILDDSTSAVDAATEAKIQDALDTLIRDRNSTVFVIAQRISTVRDADTILLLDAGKLVAQGTHQELLSESPLYHEILGSQVRAVPRALVAGET